MIKILIKEKEIKISGHALYDEFGKDIVCSAVSSIATTTVNAIIRFDENAVSYETKDGLNIKILKETKETRILIDNMIALLEELEQDYPKNIKINREV